METSSITVATSKTEKATVQQSSSKKCSCFRKAEVVIAVLLLVYLVLYLLPWDNYPKMIRKLLTLSPRHITSNDSITPTIEGQVFLLIIINSIPKTASRRTVLRETWAGTAQTNTPGKSLNTQNTFNNNLQVFCVFLVAFSSEQKENKELASEAYIHGDILRIDTAESYRNMINKVWGGYKWALKIKPQYLLKVDDDIYVNIPHLITWLHQKSLPKNLYAGWVLHLGKIMRSPGNQWYVSHAQFHEHFYPDYCIGPFYIVSGDLLDKLIKISSKITMFNVEDAYLGILMRGLKVKPLRINELFVWDPRLVTMLPKWKDKKFREVICLGERLDSQMIRFIHSKYRKIGFL
jgi:hypothetical protein